MSRLRGRHPLLGLIRNQSLIEFAFFEVAGDDCAFAPVQLSQCPCFRIEPQAGFALLRVGAMTEETFVGEERADVAIEFNGGGRELARHR